MLEKLQQNKWRVAIIIFMVLLLAAIRAYEDSIFYDPFLNYFKTDYANAALPKLENLKLSINLFARYLLNTIISLAIIFAIFKDKDLLRFAGLLYAVFFILLISAFFLTLNYIGAENKMMLFYIRRFLIQPLFLLLFIPAFYFQEHVSRKNNIS